MDLVKARKRAKEKARKEKKKKPAKRKKRPAASPPKRALSPPEKKTATGAGLAAEAEPHAGPEPAAAKESRPGARTEASEEEVFTDDAFGEDLPPLRPGDELEDELVLDAAAQKLKPAKPEKKKLPELVIEPDASEDEQGWELELEQMKKTEKKPAAPAAREQARKSLFQAEDDFRGKEVSEPAAGPAKAARRGQGRIKEPPGTSALSASGDELEFEWEKPGREWSLDDMKDDEFFSLVTEDLYMREFGRPDEHEFGSVLELLSFRLAREIYAVRLTSIRQIIKMMPITMVPRAPDYVLGVISLRGTIIPVFDLRRRLNLSAANPTRKARIVVVAEGKYMVGLIVDEVEQVVRLPEGSLEPPPPMLAGVEAGYLEGIGRQAQKMILLLALEKILTPLNAVKEKR